MPEIGEMQIARQEQSKELRQRVMWPVFFGGCVAAVVVQVVCKSLELRDIDFHMLKIGRFPE